MADPLALIRDDADVLPGRGVRAVFPCQLERKIVGYGFADDVYSLLSASRVIVCAQHRDPLVLMWIRRRREVTALERGPCRVLAGARVNLQGLQAEHRIPEGGEPVPQSATPGSVSMARTASPGSSALPR